MKKPVSPPLKTIVGGTVDRKEIKAAVTAYFDGLEEFLFPVALKDQKNLSQLTQIRNIIRKRLQSVEPLTAAIVEEINIRAQTLDGKIYQNLLSEDRKRWLKNGKEDFPFGVRACVDQGIPREAVVGDGYMGRSLAGDDDLIYVPAKKCFSFQPSTFVKRLRHAGRMGTGIVLEPLIEHTGCGRRGEMIANWTTENKIAQLFHLVLSHLDALQSEFVANTSEIETGIKKLKIAIGPVETTHGLKMAKDGGLWLGILTKIAQRQAYRFLGEHITVICPIEVYDKLNGNLLVGLDALKALTHPRVIEEGGFTEVAIKQLILEGIIFSLQHELSRFDTLLAANNINLSDELSVAKGAYTFADLQKSWLQVKQSFVTVTQKLWSFHDAPDQKFSELQKITERFIGHGLATYKITADKTEIANLIKRRLKHQLFRALAYVWVLDTFTRGNPPGHHIENHLATGDSAELGVKLNLPLGQGDMNPPSAAEFFTGRSVLMHSIPGHDGQPVLVFLKLDTDRPDNEPMTTEETQRAIDDFKEFLKLWPYFLVGDMVPVFVIRGKRHGGVSRLGLSVIKAFGDVVDMFSSGLAELVPAANSKGEVVLVSAQAILKAGVMAGENLRTFRAQVQMLADSISDGAYQKRFTQ